MDNSEIKAIKMCQTGDTKQFGFLYDKYIKKIYDFIYYKTQHKETAEDLTSQVFIKAIDKISSFDINKGTFQAWIYQIARNRVIDHYRTKRQEANIEDVWDLDDGSDIERDIDTKDKLARVKEYMAVLKSEQRDILIMRIWQGMSHQEIAAVLGKTEASIKMSYSRTMTKLRQDMDTAAWLGFLITPLLLK